MSYCRFSTNGFRSDVYAYQDNNEAYVVHVAATRAIIPDDLNPPGFDTPPDRFTEIYLTWYRAYDALPRVTLAQESAGKTFYESTLEDLEERLRDLQAEGLTVPDMAFEEIEFEMRDKEGTLP